MTGTALSGWAVAVGSDLHHLQQAPTKLLKHGATLSHIRQYLGQVSGRMAELHQSAHGPGRRPPSRVGSRPRRPNPGELLTSATARMERHEALALALDLSRRSTPPTADDSQAAVLLAAYAQRPALPWWFATLACCLR